MNDGQVRALLECEYRFYRVSEPAIFETHSVRLGYKQAPPVEKLTSEELSQLNRRIRAILLVPKA